MLKCEIPITECAVRVSNITVRQSGAFSELSGMVDDFRVWFRFPAEYAFSTRGDPFLACSLVPAMVRGEALEIEPEAPVSPRLVEGAQQFQDIYHCWNPVFRKIEIRASLVPAQPANAGVASFFSGGLDAAYTYLKHAGEITHLIFIRGFDLSFTNDAVFERSRNLYREFAAGQGKKLVYVETGAKQACAHFNLRFNPYHGSLLGSIGLALGFSRIYIASGDPYDRLLPHGSHPLTDILWTTEATQFVHDGAEARRTEKLRRVAAFEPAIRILRVCFEDSDYNCGVCTKCLRTRIALRALGLSVPTLPPLTSLKPVRRLRISDDSDLNEYLDNWRLAGEMGDRELYSVLGWLIGKYKTRKYLKEADELFLGGRARRWRRSLRLLRRGPPLPERVNF